jgi:hypothetical protein
MYCAVAVEKTAANKGECHESPDSCNVDHQRQPTISRDYGAPVHPGR